MFKTFDELNNKLREFKGQVVTVDIKCPYCKKITRNADSIIVDEHLEDFKTEFQFYKTHYFTCLNQCHQEVRYSYINVQKVRSKGTLQELAEFSIKPHLLVEFGDIWINSISQKMLLVEPERILNVFSNPLRKAFIHSTDLNEDIDVEQKKLEAFRKVNGADKDYIKLLKKFILKEYPTIIYPEFYDPEKDLAKGKILDLDTLTFYEIGDVPLAQYTSVNDIEVGHFYLDPLSPNISSDTSVFDESAEIVIAFMYLAFSNNSTLPRKLGQIISSTNEQLKNKYIELRLHPLYGLYVPVQITNSIPAMYQQA